MIHLRLQRIDHERCGLWIRLLHISHGRGRVLIGLKSRLQIDGLPRRLGECGWCRCRWTHVRDGINHGVEGSGMRRLSVRLKRKSKVRGIVVVHRMSRLRVELTGHCRIAVRHEHWRRGG